MNWFDKLLAKIAVAKAAARYKDSPVRTADALLAAFRTINSETSGTSPSGDPEEQK